jgi:hypothetical protein
VLTVDQLGEVGRARRRFSSDSLAISRNLFSSYLRLTKYDPMLQWEAANVTR